MRYSVIMRRKDGSGRFEIAKPGEYSEAHCRWLARTLNAIRLGLSPDEAAYEYVVEDHCEEDEL